MKNKISAILAFILGVLLSGITVYAATMINSKDVSYDNKNGMKSNNVQDAVDELYDISSKPSTSIQLLWENTDVTKAFPAQYVCVNGKDYESFIFLTTLSSSNPTQNQGLVIVNKNSNDDKYNAAGVPNVGYNASRTVTITDNDSRCTDSTKKTAIDFGVCQWSTTNATAACIPVKIWGFNHNGVVDYYK